MFEKIYLVANYVINNGINSATLEGNGCGVHSAVTRISR